MSKIKSALEIALERTQDIKSDKKILHVNNMKDEGKKLISEYLKMNSDLDLSEALKKGDKEEQKWRSEGALEVLLANLVLPNSPEFTDSLARVREGITLILGKKGELKAIFSQVTEFFQQYLENQKVLEEQLSAQFAPTLRQKEAKIAQQFGEPVHLEPDQDPEFRALLKENLVKLSSQYQQALTGLKEELKSKF
jgi:hypothetical protein